jgi:hypothetical protein
MSHLIGTHELFFECIVYKFLKNLAQKWYLQEK